MNGLTYALVCVAVPAAWGVLMYFVFGLVDRRRGAAQPPPPGRPAARRLLDLMDLSLAVDGHDVSLVGLLLLGIIVGYVAGMFGVGGGFLLTPLLVVVFGVPLPVAVGTGLCQMIGTSIVALLRHLRSGQGEVRFDLLMIPGAFLGAQAGAWTLTALVASGSVNVLGHPVPLVNLVVELLYATMLLTISGIFWRQGTTAMDTLELARKGALAMIPLPPRVRLPAVPPLQAPAILVAWVGLAMGFLSGLLGIGGGVALLPILVYGFGFPIRQAAGTGILMLVATSAYGTFVHARLGHVNLPLAMVLLAGSSISAQLGARATKRLSARALRKVFAIVVVITAAAVLWKLASRM